MKCHSPTSTLFFAMNDSRNLPNNTVHQEVNSRIRLSSRQPGAREKQHPTSSLAVVQMGKAWDIGVLTKSRAQGSLHIVAALLSEELLQASATAQPQHPRIVIRNRSSHDVRAMLQLGQSTLVIPNIKGACRSRILNRED